jgi:hypothetical protein
MAAAVGELVAEPTDGTDEIAIIAKPAEFIEHDAFTITVDVGAINDAAPDGCGVCDTDRACSTRRERHRYYDQRQHGQPGGRRDLECHGRRSDQ